MTSRNRRVLVTGAAGFLGSALLRSLAASGHTVSGLDLPAAAPETESPWFPVDLRDRRAVFAAVATSGCDAVVHAAALLPNAAPADIAATNVGGTLHLLDAARAAGVRRVVFLSTSAVHPADPADSAPPGAYGASKIEGERLCADARAAGLEVAVLRVVPVVGPGRLGLFGMLFSWVLEGRRIPMLGDGANRHQLLDLDDACAAVEQLLGAAPDALDAPFEAGAARTGSVREDLEFLCSAARTGARPVSVPVALVRSPLHALHRLGLSPVHPRVVATGAVDATVSIHRLLATGWSPAHSSAEALLRAYRWYAALPEADRAARGPGHRGAWETRTLALVRRFF